MRSLPFQGLEHGWPTALPCCVWSQGEPGRGRKGLAVGAVGDQFVTPGGGETWGWVGKHCLCLFHWDRWMLSGAHLVLVVHLSAAPWPGVQPGWSTYAA